MHNLALNRVSIRSFLLLPLRNVAEMLNLHCPASFISLVESVGKEMETSKLEKGQAMLAPVHQETQLLQAKFVNSRPTLPPPQLHITLLSHGAAMNKTNKILLAKG